MNTHTIPHTSHTHPQTITHHMPHAYRTCPTYIPHATPTEHTHDTHHTPHTYHMPTLYKPRTHHTRMHSIMFTYNLLLFGASQLGNLCQSSSLVLCGMNRNECWVKCHIKDTNTLHSWRSVRSEAVTLFPPIPTLTPWWHNRFATWQHSLQSCYIRLYKC